VHSNLRFGAPRLGPKASYARVVQEQARLGRERHYRGFAMAGRARGRRQNAGSRRPTDMNRHSLREPAQKNQEAKVTLTEGLRRTRTQQRAAGDEDRRRRRAGAPGGTAAEVIGASGLRGSVRGAPVEVAMGLRRPKTHRRRGITLQRVTYRRRINGGGAFQSERWRAVQRLGRAGRLLRIRVGPSSGCG
jgi:hypothetical protein